ncbi:MAG: hypothetical protein J3K34DRAFT_406691 [Monoraphidium minutum]|nr:MAG: hypothetical protein J3K34DRAFT_406691 [Monoraphidium minutum]
MGPPRARLCARGATVLATGWGCVWAGLPWLGGKARILRDRKAKAGPAGRRAEAEECCVCLGHDWARTGGGH